MMQAIPDPDSQHLRCRIGKTIDFIEVSMIQLIENRLHGARDLREVGYPAQVRINRSGDMNLTPKRVTMETVAFVVRRHVR